MDLTCLIPTENPEVGRPERLDLHAMLWHFLHFRLDVVTRRLEHELAAIKKRTHILEGFEKIFDALDEILRIVRKSEGKADAAQQIMKRFDLDADQTDAILELKIYRLARLEKSIADLEEKSKAMTARWEAEKKKLGSAQKIKEELDSLRNALEQAQRKGDLARAGELRYGKIPELEKRLASIETQEGKGAMVEEAVTPDQIAAVVKSGGSTPSPGSGSGAKAQPWGSPGSEKNVGVSLPTWRPLRSKTPKPGGGEGWRVSSPITKLPLPSGNAHIIPFTSRLGRTKRSSSSPPPLSPLAFWISTSSSCGFFPVPPIVSTSTRWRRLPSAK